MLLRTFLFLFVLVVFPAEMPVVRAGTVDTSRYYTRHSYDVLKYKLEADFYSCFQSPYPRSFPAKIRISLRVDSALNIIRLNAISSSIGIDSVALPVADWDHHADTLTLHLDRQYQPGEMMDLEIAYHHNNVNDKGFYSGYGTIFTDNPPEGARKWMPCWDRPSDKATWELIARVQAPSILASNGLPVGEPVFSGDTVTYHWKTDIPVSTYLITLSARNIFLSKVSWYQRSQDPADSIPVMLYYRNNDNIALIDTIIGPMTDFYASLFGNYPFEKIGFATLNSTFPWGGMENQSMVHLRPNGFADEDLIAHEHAHQWFGDMVTCGTWADIWLNEGFGTYCQKLWVEHSNGDSLYRIAMNKIASQYLATNPGWPVYQPAWAIQTPNPNSLYNEAISYNKAACVLYMLRYVMGDSSFFRALRTYLEDPLLRFNFAVTADFQRHVNQVAAESLDWFFDQWIYGPDHPVFHNTYETDSLGQNDWKLVIIMNQVQATTGFFRMPVDFRIKFANGSDTLVSVINNINNQIFGFHFTDKPVGVVFDPDQKILLKKGTTIYRIPELPAGSQDLSISNNPNPFRHTTLISYKIPDAAHVRITITDLMGRTISVLVDVNHQPGCYRFDYRNEGITPGVYLMVLEAGNTVRSRKILVTD